MDNIISNIKENINLKWIKKIILILNKNLIKEFLKYVSIQLLKKMLINQKKKIEQKQEKIIPILQSGEKTLYF